MSRNEKDIVRENTIFVIFVVFVILCGIWISNHNKEKLQNIKLYKKGVKLINDLKFADGVRTLQELDKPYKDSEKLIKDYEDFVILEQKFTKLSKMTNELKKFRDSDKSIKSYNELLKHFDIEKEGTGLNMKLKLIKPENNRL